MLQKNQIEMILRVNGVNLHSSDEEIRSVLLSASFNNNDVDTAIMILRENTKTKTSSIEGLHKVFRTNEKLKPNEISNLLGINIQVDDLPQERQVKKPETPVWAQNASIILSAFAIASIGVIFAMYVYDVGLFYQTNSASASK